MAKTKVVYKQVSGTTLLFLVFLVLKLTHVINWSWWWVFAPFWIPLAVVIVILLISFIAYLLS